MTTDAPDPITPEPPPRGDISTQLLGITDPVIAAAVIMGELRHIDQTAETPMLPPRSWVIDVCRVCSRLAAWPFCEHRAAWPPASEVPWFEPVTVYERRRR